MLFFLNNNFTIDKQIFQFDKTQKVTYTNSEIFTKYKT